jgi:hypothetical protein
MLRYFLWMAGLSPKAQWKITMEAASRLYGVTMQERGVSKLVSVELDDVQPREELAAVSV